MRLTIGITIMVIIIIILGIIGYFTIVNMANNVNNLLVKLQNNIEKENWGQARTTSKQLIREWNKAQYILTILVNHAELDELEVRLAKISSLVNLKEKNEVLPEISIAKKLIENIPEQEKLTLKNIF